jgi:iron complex outermembrane receptor protein
MNTPLNQAHRPHGLGPARRLWRPLLMCALISMADPARASETPDLTSLSLESLLQLTVVGASRYEQRQRDVAAAVSLITRSEIKAHGWRTLAEALASLPGVHTSYDRQYTYVGMRGFGLPGDLSARLLVTIDGNRVNDPAYDGGVFGREFPLDMHLVERIEFIPGPGGAVYGQNAMLGVINVITRGGAEMDGTELSLATQQPQRLRDLRLSHGRRLNNGVDLLLSASRMSAKGEDRFTDFGSAGVSGVATGQDAEQVQQLHGSRRKDDPVASFLSDPLVPGQFTRDTFTLAQMEFERDLLVDSVKLVGRLFAGRYRYEQDFFFSGSPSTASTRSDWYGTDLRLLYTAWRHHTLLLGLEAQKNLRTDQTITYPTDPTLDVHIPGDGSRLGLYLQDEWRIAPTLRATLGLRVDRNSATGTQHSPRAALIWQASGQTTLKALYGRAYRAANVYERDYEDPLWKSNPALRGEAIGTLEVVADHRVNSDLSVRGSVYQWTMRDLIVLGSDAGSGLPQYQSGPKVKARGLELSADKTWNHGARLRGSVSVQNLAWADGSRLPNSPQWLAKLNLWTPLPWMGLRAGYEFRYDSRRLSLDGGWLPGRALSNLHLSTEAVAEGLELSLNIANLFDKRYAYPVDRSNWQNSLEQDGRSVRLMLSHRF